MELIRGKHNLTDRLQGSVITMGNFDGMHLGHQALLHKVEEVGKQLKLPTVLITFEPQPKEFFAKRQTVPRLMRLREKCVVLQGYAIDYVLCLRFNQSLANLSAEDFVKQILIDQLGVKAIIIGDDFCFGAKRAGNLALLKKCGERYNFQAIAVPTVIFKKERVSSTRVRHALQVGDMKLVHELLGRPYCLCGKVVYGEQRGRDLGFPTANINLHRELVPLSGVFVIRALGLGDKPYDGVANVGIRPTFNGTRVLLEVYLFDFNAEIYGHQLQVEFLHKLRDEVRFDSVEKLIKQIRQDVIDAKKVLGTRC